MRFLRSAFLVLFSVLPFLSCFAQTPVQHTITANLSSISTSNSDVLQVRFTLANCGQANPVVPGVTIPVTKIKLFTAAQGTGVVTGSLWGNDQISCNLGFTTVYQVQYLRNNVPTGTTEIYRTVCTAAVGTTCNWDLTSAEPVATLPSVNMPASGYTCPAATPVMAGILYDWTPVCITVGAASVLPADIDTDLGTLPACSTQGMVYSPAAHGCIPMAVSLAGDANGPMGTNQVTSLHVTSGFVNNTPIGAGGASTGAFTNLTSFSLRSVYGRFGPSDCDAQMVDTLQACANDPTNIFEVHNGSGAAANLMAGMKFSADPIGVGNQPQYEPVGSIYFDPSGKGIEEFRVQSAPSGSNVIDWTPQAFAISSPLQLPIGSAGCLQMAASGLVSSTGNPCGTGGGGGGGSPTGNAGGDLGGSYPSPTVLSVHATSGTLDGVTIGSKTPAAASFTTLYTTQKATLAALATGGATITGGTIDGTAIGSQSPATGTFTTLAASGGALNGVAIGTASASTGRFSSLVSTGAANFAGMTTASATITGGTIDGTAIGATAPSTGAFTAITTGALTVGAQPVCLQNGTNCPNASLSGTAYTLSMFNAQGNALANSLLSQSTDGSSLNAAGNLFVGSQFTAASGLPCPGYSNNNTACLTISGAQYPQLFFRSANAPAGQKNMRFVSANGELLLQALTDDGSTGSQNVFLFPNASTATTPSVQFQVGVATQFMPGMGGASGANYLVPNTASDTTSAVNVQPNGTLYENAYLSGATSPYGAGLQSTFVNLQSGYDQAPGNQYGSSLVTRYGSTHGIGIRNLDSLIDSEFGAEGDINAFARYIYFNGSPTDPADEGAHPGSNENYGDLAQTTGNIYCCFAGAAGGQLITIPNANGGNLGVGQLLMDTSASFTATVTGNSGTTVTVSSNFSQAASVTGTLSSAITVATGTPVDKGQALTGIVFNTPSSPQGVPTIIWGTSHSEVVYPTSCSGSAGAYTCSLTARYDHNPSDGVAFGGLAGYCAYDPTHGYQAVVNGVTNEWVEQVYSNTANTATLGHNAYGSSGASFLSSVRSALVFAPCATVVSVARFDTGGLGNGGEMTVGPTSALFNANDSYQAVNLIAEVVSDRKELIEYHNTYMNALTAWEHVNASLMGAGMNNGSYFHLNTIGNTNISFAQLLGTGWGSGLYFENQPTGAGQGAGSLTGLPFLLGVTNITSDFPVAVMQGSFGIARLDFDPVNGWALAGQNGALSMTNALTLNIDSQSGAGSNGLIAMSDNFGATLLGTTYTMLPLFPQFPTVFAGAFGYVPGQGLCSSNKYQHPVAGCNAVSNSFALQMEGHAFNLLGNDGSSPITSSFDASGNFMTAGTVNLPALKANTGTVFLCVDTNGNVVKQTTACSGT